MIAASGGLLLVDKAQGLTSHDVVARVRRAARTRRVGHAGTLDPFATGLLVIAVGEVTRLLPYLDAEPKVYDAGIQFGSETNTDDSTGTVTREAPLPDARAVDAAIVSLTGTLSQLPPAFSAKHVDGERAYVRARRGEAVALEPSRVTVHSWDVTDRTADSLTARITCSGGTYIRALARDLGVAASSAAHCATLRRVSSGSAHVNDAVGSDALVPGAIVDGVVPLHNPLMYLAHLGLVKLDAGGVDHVAHGRAIPAAHDDALRCVFVDEHDTVIGVGERIAAPGGDRWQPRVVLPQAAGAST